MVEVKAMAKTWRFMMQLNYSYDGLGRKVDEHCLCSFFLLSKTFCCACYDALLVEMLDWS